MQRDGLKNVMSARPAIWPAFACKVVVGFDEHPMLSHAIHHNRVAQMIEQRTRTFEIALTFGPLNMSCTKM